MKRTTYGVPVRDADVPLMEANHAATRSWSELHYKADTLAKELRAVRRAERAAWKQCQAAGSAFGETISGKLYSEACQRSYEAARRAREVHADAPEPTWHPLVIEWIFREAARELFAQLFIRYARMLAGEPWAMITQVWEIRILRALDSVNGTGWRYEWNSRTGRWAIYQPDPDAVDDFDDDLDYAVELEGAHA